MNNSNQTLDIHCRHCLCTAEYDIADDPLPNMALTDVAKIKDFFKKKTELIALVTSSEKFVTVTTLAAPHFVISDITQSSCPNQMKT